MAYRPDLTVANVLDVVARPNNESVRMVHDFINRCIGKKTHDRERLSEDVVRRVINHYLNREIDRKAAFELLGV